MATSKTLTPTNVTIQIPEFTEQPDQRVNSNCIDKEADAINALNTQIANLATQTGLATYSGTSSQSVALNETASNYLFLCIRLYDSNNNVVGTLLAPTNLLRNLTYKIYGESSSQWGSILLANDYNSITCNRTSANTSSMNIYGIMKV